MNIRGDPLTQDSLERAFARAAHSPELPASGVDFVLREAGDASGFGGSDPWSRDRLGAVRENAPIEPEFCSLSRRLTTHELDALAALAPDGDERLLELRRQGK